MPGETITAKVDQVDGAVDATEKSLIQEALRDRGVKSAYTIDAEGLMVALNLAIHFQNPEDYQSVAGPVPELGIAEVRYAA